jgi:hypothetical protein
MHPRNYLRAVAVSVAGGGGRCSARDFSLGRTSKSQ